MKQLGFHCISHAAWVQRESTDPSDELVGLVAVRYYRFDRRVRVGRFRLCPIALRWAPKAYTRPDHLTISRFHESGCWEPVADLHLPVIGEEEWHEVDLGGLETDHLRVVCDREHPVEECHSEFAYATWNVPFRILEKVEWLGETADETAPEPPYEGILSVGSVSPNVPEGMEVADSPGEVRFRSPGFKVGFSLIRPIMTHLAWDVLGSGLVDRSLLRLDSRLNYRFNNQLPGDLASGPWFSGLTCDAPPIYWTGSVSVEGNKVSYSDLHLIPGLSLDAHFTVHADGMDVSIHQRAERDIYAPEFESWRFFWNGSEAITGTLAIPKQNTGRTGLVNLPALWSAPGHGTVLVQQKSGDAAYLQVDSIRNLCLGMSGIMIGAEHDDLGLVKIRKGQHCADLSVRIHEMRPLVQEGVKPADLPTGIRRNWPVSFTFRPELGGFSNNCMSGNCHMVHHDAVDVCAYTKVLTGEPSVMDMARYTVGLAMKGGPGYGEIRDMYMDSDPSLLCAVGRIHQVAPDADWLKDMEPWIRSAAERIMDQFDESGLYLCRRLSGNSGSGAWSSNAWDVVSFGHYDAYSNALAYRGLRNASALMFDAGDEAFGRRCSESADAIKAAYERCFYNPHTRWLGGWRSRDGMLHDYAFTFINAMAVCFDLVEGETARSIMQKIEAKREDIGYRDFHYGLPPNYISLRQEDVPMEQKSRRADGLDMFGIYLNGSATTVLMAYYLRALSKCGLTKTADTICDHLEESFADNRIVGPLFSGTELFTWFGAPCGYEGVCQGQFRVLQAIAQHRGLIEPLDPEWWPGSPDQ